MLELTEASGAWTEERDGRLKSKGLTWHVPREDFQVTIKRVGRYLSITLITETTISQLHRCWTAGVRRLGAGGECQGQGPRTGGGWERTGLKDSDVERKKVLCWAHPPKLDTCPSLGHISPRLTPRVSV